MSVLLRNIWHGLIRDFYSTKKKNGLHKNNVKALYKIVFHTEIAFFLVPRGLLKFICTCFKVPYCEFEVAFNTSKVTTEYSE